MSEGASTTRPPEEDELRVLNPHLVLHLGVLGWSSSAAQSSKGTTLAVNGRGRFLPARLALETRVGPLSVNPGHPLATAEVQVALTRGSTDGASSLSCYPPDLAQSPHPTVYVTVSLDPVAFDVLHSALAKGLPMPRILTLTVPKARVRLLDGEPRMWPVLEGDQTIASVTWSVRTGQRDDNPDFVVADLRVTVQRVLDNVDWTHLGWLYTHSQHQRVAAELMVSAWLSGDLASHSEHREDVNAAWAMAGDLFWMLGDAEWQTRFERRQHRYTTKARLPASAALPWRKRSPETDFMEGFDSHDWVAVNKEAAGEMAFRYLASSFDSPTLEWILTDALIYAEVNAYGDAVKRGLGSLIPQQDYMQTGGSMRKMAMRRLWRQVPLSLLRTAFWLGIPGYYASKEWEAGNLIGAGLLMAAGVVGLSLWPKLKLAFNSGNPERDAEERRQRKLLTDMTSAYKAVALNRPPGDILRTLQIVGDQGAVWDGPTLALLSAAHARNPVVWARGLTDQSLDRLTDAVQRCIADAASARQKAGDINTPDFDAEDSMKVWRRDA